MRAIVRGEQPPGLRLTHLLAADLPSILAAAAGAVRVSNLGMIQADVAWPATHRSDRVEALKILSLLLPVFS